LNIKRYAKFFSVFLSVICFSITASAGLPEEQKLNADSVNVPVIMYHSISQKVTNEWTLTPEALEDDLAYLAENGYHAVSPAQLVAFVDEGTPLPEKPVMLTFDDGCYNNYVTAMPLLEKYDMNMVLSVIGENTEKWSQARELDERYGHLTWEQLGEMADSGRVELSNHTWAFHTNAKGRRGACRKQGESLAGYERELTADLSRLQDKLSETCGVEPICFAYPFGARCPEANDILKKMGFRVTLTCYEGMNKITTGAPDSLFNLKRANRTPARSVSAILKKLEAV